jgi:hypothetical protein
MTSDVSDPRYDELFEPLSLSLGHVVFAATALEKALLADLVQRRVIRDGPEEVFGGRLVSRLLNKPAGVLLDELRQLGYEAELAAELATVIDGRNHFIHHLFEDPEFIEVFASRRGVDQIVARVESLVQSIYTAAGKLRPGLAADTSRLFGRSTAELLGALKHLDLSEIDDADLRRQLEAVRTLPDGFP